MHYQLVKNFRILKIASLIYRFGLEPRRVNQWPGRSVNWCPRMWSLSCQRSPAMTSRRSGTMNLSPTRAPGWPTHSTARSRRPPTAGPSPGRTVNRLHGMNAGKYDASSDAMASQNSKVQRSKGSLVTRFYSKSAKLHIILRNMNIFYNQ